MGRIAKLKQSLKVRILAMMIMPVFVFTTNISHIENTLNSGLFWFYILFCVCVIVFAWLNYKVLRRMDIMDSVVKIHLEEQVLLLQSMLRQNLIGIRVALLLFILLLEILPYLQDYKMLNTWHSLSPVLRFSAYAALITFQYFVTRIITQRKFGKHIAHLKEHVMEMQ